MKNSPNKPPSEFLTEEEEHAVASNNSEESKHLQIGRIGEAHACRILWRCGFRILERNFKGHRGEIDIIAEKKQILHFIEVKTRTSSSIAPPEEAVDANKRKALRLTARQYLEQFRDPPSDGQQFDVFAQIVNSQGQIISHNFIEDAF